MGAAIAAGEDMIPAAIEAVAMTLVVIEAVVALAAAAATVATVMAAAAGTNAVDMEAAVNLLLLLLFSRNQSLQTQKGRVP